MRFAVRLLHPKFLIMGSLLSSSIFTSAYAEEHLSSLDTVTVVATKSPQRTFDIPGMVTVVNADDPSVAGSSKVKNLLLDVPGVEFNGSARRNGQNISLRGFGTEGLVILFDGVRQKFESAHDGKFFIDPNLIKNVEVVRGPNSTLYGSGGLGGVVAFKTKDASDLLAPGETQGVLTSAGYESVNKEWLVSQAAYARSDNYDVIANVLTRHSRDIDLGDDSTLESDDEVFSGLIKVGWSATDNSTVKLNVRAYRNDAEEPNNAQSSSNADPLEKDTTSYTTSMSYEYDNPEDSLLNLTARVYFTNTEVDEVEEDTARNLSRQMDTVGFSLENQSHFGAGSNFVNTLTYGGEIYNEEQDGSDSATADNVAGGIPDAETDFWGIFLQDEISWNPDVVPGEFLIIPSVRLDNYESDNTTGLSLDESEVSPKFGITYKPNDWLMVFGSYAHAFRAPSMTEVFTTGTHFTIPGLGSNVFVPNPDLKPETSKTTEFGFGMTFDNIWKDNDNLQFKVSRFNTQVEDFIDLSVDFVFFPVCCGTTMSENIPDASLHGVEFEGGYENDRVKFSLAYSKTTGTDEETGEYLNNISPHTVTTNIGLKIPRRDAMVGWRARLVAEHNEVNDPSAVRSRYGVHDLYLQWQPENMDSLTVNFGIDNVFDKSYSRVFAGSTEPGRNYRIQANSKW